MAVIVGSAGVTFNESEVLVNSNARRVSGVGIVGGASKGSTEVTHVASPYALESIFGQDLNTDWGLKAAKLILTKTNNLYYRRAISASAAKAVAGRTSDFISYQTKNYTDFYNGFTVKTEVDFDNDTVSIQLFSTSGARVGSWASFSLTEEKPNYVEKLFNKKSADIEIIVNEDAIPTATTGKQTYVYTFHDGDSGASDLTAEDICEALNDYKDPEVIDVATVLAPGWFDQKVRDRAEEMCAYRGECEYILEIPQGLDYDEAKAFTDALGDYSNIPSALDNQYLAVAAPWILMYDSTLKQQILYPASAILVKTLCQSEALADPWSAAAGMQNNDAFSRGKVADALGVEFRFNKEQRDEVASGTGVINPIVYLQQGIFVWGNLTTKRASADDDEPISFMCQLSIRRLTNYIRKEIIRLSMGELFEGNISSTWKKWELGVGSFLRTIQSGNGIRAYSVLMDENTTTEEFIRKREMRGVVYVWPVEIAEKLIISYITTNDGTYFEESAEAA